MALILRNQGVGGAGISLHSGQVSHPQAAFLAHFRQANSTFLSGKAAQNGFVGFLQKIGRMFQEDFSPPFDGFFFLKLVLYLAFFTFCLRVFGGGSCLGTTPEGRPEGKIIQSPLEHPSHPEDASHRMAKASRTRELLSTTPLTHGVL